VGFLTSFVRFDDDREQSGQPGLGKQQIPFGQTQVDVQTAEFGQPPTDEQTQTSGLQPSYITAVSLWTTTDSWIAASVRTAVTPAWATPCVCAATGAWTNANVYPTADAKAIAGHGEGSALGQPTIPGQPQMVGQFPGWNSRRKSDDHPF
jgi:hypothetical protein